MKIVIAIAALVLALQGAWKTDFEKAKQEAAQAKKNIIISFSGSDWCLPCMRMKKEIFDSEAFLDYAKDNLVLVQADFPRQKKNLLDPKQTEQNEALAEKYDPAGNFPCTVLLSPAGTVVKSWNGYPDMSAAQFVEALKTAARDAK